MEKITLYSRDSKSNILSWSVEVIHYSEASQDSNIDASVIVIYEGLIEGKKTETTTTVHKGKNIGKMNEKTHYYQAVSQSKSKVEKKKKQGYKSLEDLEIYFQNKLDSVYQKNFPYHKGIYDYDSLKVALEDVLPKNRTDANNVSKPMKAQPYYKVKTVAGKKIKTNEPVIKFPCFGQPKLNGFRVICRWEKVLLEQGTVFEQETYKPVFRSKEGLRYDILEHIEQELTELMFKWQINGKEIDLAFDGEMYIHSEILSEISSAVRKRNEKTPLLKFCIFDLAVEDLRQDERTRILDELGNTFGGNNFKNLFSVPCHNIESNKEAQDFADDCIEKGYEGAIFRDKKATYQFGKRPQTMTKLKRSQDKEFIITDIVGGENTPELGVFVCVAENGKTFKVTPEGTEERKKMYLRDKIKYIGKSLTVKFFERTIDELPFHATGIDIRDYE